MYDITNFTVYLNFTCSNDNKLQEQTVILLKNLPDVYPLVSAA